jgi:hypothetical protein
MNAVPVADAAKVAASELTAASEVREAGAVAVY